MEEKENTSNSVKTIFTIIIIAAAVLIGAFFLIKNLLCRRSYTKIIASNFVAYDLTRAVMGNDANITMLVEPGQNFHNYDASSSDLDAIKESDLFVYIGGDSESWAKKVINEENQYDQKFLKLSSFIGLITDASEDPNAENDYYQYNSDQKFDEHIWMLLTNAITMTHAIAERLSLIYPENRDMYYENAQTYTMRLNEIDQQFRHPFYEFGSRTVAVTDAFPFAYMLREYNVDYVSMAKGCGKHTKLEDTATFINDAKTKHVVAVLKSELAGNELAVTTAAELGVPVYEINAVHSISKEDFEAGVTLIDIMQKNLDSFLKIFAQEKR